MAAGAAHGFTVAPDGPADSRKAVRVAGNENSGRRSLGQSLLADSLHEHLERAAALLGKDGLTPEEEEWIAGSHELVKRQEVTASKTTLARALLEDDDVTAACLRLATHHGERFGPLIRLAGA